MPLPYLTARLPGTGGAIKLAPEDFEVDEVALYPCSGAGEHLYLRVEKRGRTTSDVGRELAQALGRPAGAVGWAGMKDAHAVARQWLSVQGAQGGEELAGEGWRVLEVARHSNKLRPGHLAGNRFRIALRGVGPQAPAQARAVLDALAAQGGAPNYFGEQRFGRGDNAAVGKALLLGQERMPEQAAQASANAQRERAFRERALAPAPPSSRPVKQDKFRRKLALSAYQSELFNRWLAERVQEGLFARAIAGDVMKKRDTGGLFVCADPAADQPRVDAGAIDPTGPMFGWKMKSAEGEEAEREARILAAEALALEDFRAGRGETEGTRRPARAPIEDAQVEPAEGALWISFTLPAGAYATVVLGEITKS